MSALNLPSAADLERLTRRLRSVSQRLEGIEDGVDRLDRRLEEVGRVAAPPGDRLAALEAQVGKLAAEVAQLTAALGAAPVPMPREQERLEVDDAPEASRSRRPGRQAAADSRRRSAQRAPRRPRRARTRAAPARRRRAARPSARVTPRIGGGRGAGARRGGEHGRGGEVDGERALREPSPRRGAGSCTSAEATSPRRSPCQRRCERRIGRDAAGRAERPARAVRGDRRLDDDDRPERRRAEPGGRSDAHQPPRPEPDRARPRRRRRSGRRGPVLWIVSGAPSAAGPVYPHSPR